MNRCRLCAEIVDDNKCVNISENSYMLEVIRRMLPVVVISGDTLPQHICPNCTDRLNDLDKFYKTTAEADRKLRELYWGVRELPEVTDPMIVFNAILTPALKHFISEPLDERFIINRIEPTGTVILSCKTCKRTYVKESSAASHICDQNPTERVKIKAKKAKTKRRRKRSREKIKLYVCEFCSKVFQYETELSLHRATHDSSSSTGYGEQLGDISAERSDSEGKSYSCSFCNKCFTRKTKKVSHEGRHVENCCF